MSEQERLAKLIDELEEEKKKLYKEIANLEDAIDEINWRLDEVHLEMEMVKSA